jgi:GNAT superfamily N-acetyltransferase
MSIRDDEFWARFLGIESSDWNSPGLSIRAHVGLIGYRGLWCFRRNERVVVSAPEGWVSYLSERLTQDSTSKLLDEAFLLDLLGEDFEYLIGPAFQGCLDPTRFRHFHASEVRCLTSDDNVAYEQFRSECGAASLETSGLDKAAGDLMGYFRNSTLVAVCGYRPWNELAGDPCILTHPDCYGKGYGTAVTSAVVDQALRMGKLLLYQTLEANHGAVRIALRLGYQQYARHVAVRLTKDAPTSDQ